MGEWRQKEEKNLAEIRKELILVNTQLKKIQEKRVAVFSLDQMEVELSKQTQNPSLDLDFFAIDDEIFQEVFVELINEECVYVSGKCKEEIIYCLLNELRRLNTGRMVLVVKREEDWENLRFVNEEDRELGDKILIPWFCAEQIYAIPNNTNIFVYGEEEYCAGKEPVNIRKRTRKTVVDKLVAAGTDYERAYRLVEDTHGLYIPLKKKLLKGKYNIVPDWANEREELIVPLLLCGQWMENEGDQTVLEDVCGMSYERILQDIKPYMKGEDPLFISFKEHGRVIYHLAGVENAWDYLDKKVMIGDGKWKKYVNCILAIVSEPDPVFDFPEEKQYYAQLLPEGTPFWSSTLKEGLLRSLVMKAYYKKSTVNQQAIDEIVGNILSDVKSLKQWLSISCYFPTLCEASPKAVIHRLDMEWENGTGLIGVFSRKEDNELFSKKYYAHFIWGIEQLLQQKEFAAWAARWFLKMYNLGIKYSISDKLEGTTKQIFCPWYNVTALTQEEKRYLAKEAFTKNFAVWDLLYEELPGRNMTMIGMPGKPRYRAVEETKEVTNAEIWLAYKEYLTLILNDMEFDVQRWKKIIEVADHLGKQLTLMIFDKLEYELTYMEDPEIISIKNAIRREIYKHRYFCNSGWAMDEDILSHYESVLGQIKTKDPVYEYEYLFANSHDFPLLHPCPYSEDEKREINGQLAEKEIKERFTHFKECGLDVCELVSICSENVHSTLGVYLFHVYCNNSFDSELFQMIAGDEKSRYITIDYAKSAYLENHDNLGQAVGIAKELKVNDEILISLLLIEEIDASRTPLINNESEELKKKYWTCSHRYNHKDDEKTCRFVVGELCKYADQVTLIEELEGCIKYFSAEEILIIMEEMHTLEVGNASSMTSYYMKRILKKLQCEYRSSDYCIRVAKLELPYRGLLKWEDMVCLKRWLEISPKFYADMASIIYKKDEDDMQGDAQRDEQLIGSIYSLFHDVEFCPAENDGKVDRDKIFKWAENLKELLAVQKQERLFTYLLGRVLAYSPKGEDNYCPCEAVREVIQEYGDESLESAYVISIYNMRGSHSPTGGKKERELANKYKKNADALRTKYPKAASIYDKLCERYLYEADSEREREEYAGI